MTDADGVADLGSEHYESAAEVLARAFVDDPVIRYVAKDHDRLPVSAGVLRPILRHGLTYGRVWGVVEGGIVQAASIWFPPTEQPAQLQERFEIEPDALERMGTFNQWAEAVHHRAINGAHWYLEIVGVAPESQRRGLGTRLVRHGMALAALDALPVYLNTTSQANVALYSSLGFRVVAEERVSAQLRLRGMVLPTPFLQAAVER